MGGLGMGAIEEAPLGGGGGSRASQREVKASVGRGEGGGAAAGGLEGRCVTPHPTPRTSGLGACSWQMWQGRVQ